MNSRTIEEEFERNEEMRTTDLTALKTWIAGRVHLPPLSESDLALFLHRSHYDLETTKSNIETHFSIRLEMPEYFADFNPLSSDDLKQVTETASAIVLPKRTPEGYNLVLMQLLDSDPNRYDFPKAVKYLNMVLDTHIYEEGTSNGYLYICDIKKAIPEHLDRLPVQGLKKFFEYLKNGVHFRWKGMYYVNSNADPNEINDYVKANIIDIKFVENVYFYEKIEDFGKVVPLELLPIEMGGSVGHLQDLHLAQIKKIKNYVTWFKTESSLKDKGAERDMDEKDINELNKISKFIKISDNETSVS